jgi:uncharacterized membrane protein
MNQAIDSGLQAQMTQQEASAKADLSVRRLQITYRLVLIGVLTVVSIIAFTIILLWLLPGGLPAAVTLALAISAIGVTGTLVGTSVGFFLGSIGKEQADQRADRNMALLLENMQKSHELNGASSPLR